MEFVLIEVWVLSVGVRMRVILVVNEHVLRLAFLYSLDSQSGVKKQTCIYPNIHHRSGTDLFIIWSSSEKNLHFPWNTR